MSLMLLLGCWKWDENVKQHTLAQIVKSQIQLFLRQVSIYIITLALIEYFNLTKMYLQKKYRCHHSTRLKKNSVPRAKHLSCVATLIIQTHFWWDVSKHIIMSYSLGPRSLNIVLALLEKLPIMYNFLKS